MKISQRPKKKKRREPQTAARLWAKKRNFMLYRLRSMPSALADVYKLFPWLSNEAWQVEELIKQIDSRIADCDSYNRYLYQSFTHQQEQK